MAKKRYSFSANVMYSYIRALSYMFFGISKLIGVFVQLLIHAWLDATFQLNFDEFIDAHPSPSNFELLR